MSSNSAIEWTDATWNPIVGCAIVSPGCTNCYAMRMAHRIEAIADHKPSGQGGHYVGTTKVVNGHAVWTGKVAQAPAHTLTAPLRWRAPKRIFVNSMGDLFHESIPDEWIDRVFAVMALSPQHTFQVLTKRAERMRDYLTRHDIGGRWGMEVRGLVSVASETAVDWTRKGLPNVWLGVSAERQQEADERIPLLLQTPAAVRFVSAEPLLGSITFRWAKWDDWTDSKGAQREEVDHLDGVRKIDWLICGGESGRGARPMHPDWARKLRDECAEAKVPYFFKQWGEWGPGHGGDPSRDLSATYLDADGSQCTMPMGGGYDSSRSNFELMRRVGKKAAGRLLDGVEHNAMPEIMT